MPPRPLLRSVAEAMVSLFYPPSCHHCGTETETDGTLCENCRERVSEIAPPYCRQCSQPFHGEITEEFTCDNCLGQTFHFTHALCRVRNAGIVRQLILDYKYHRAFHLRRPIGEFLCRCLDDPRLQPFDLVVPVPLHPVKLRDREYNQAAGLAELLSRRTDAELVDALQRVRHTPSQTRFRREERMRNLSGAFRVRRTRSVKGRHILLVDDVFTTGATVNQCALVLRRAGAASVQVATAARS